MTINFPASASRLTSIERYHLLSDYEAAPNNIFSSMRFEGAVELDAFQAAVENTVARHPMIRCIVDESGKRWVETEWDQYVKTYPAGLPESLPHIDLRVAPGVRVHVAAGNDTTEIITQAHHASVDGQGAIDMIRELLLCYTNILNGKDPLTGLVRLSPQLLDSRNRLGILSKSYLRHWYKQPIAVLGATKFLFRDFHRIGNETPGSARFPSFDGVWLGPDDFRLIDERARESGLLKNSLFLGAFFQSLRDLLLDDHTAMQKCLRVILPMSLRQREHFRMPAANRSTVVQVDRSEKEMNDESTFYYYLDREIGLIRNWKFDRIFPLIVRSMSVSNRWLNRSAGNQKSRGTAVFTNLGEPWRWARKRGLQTGNQFRFGNLTMTSFDLLGPVRPGTPINLTVQRCGEGYRLSVHWDNRVLDQAQIESFLVCYKKNLLG